VESATILLLVGPGRGAGTTTSPLHCKPEKGFRYLLKLKPSNSLNSRERCGKKGRREGRSQKQLWNRKMHG